MEENHYARPTRPPRGKGRSRPGHSVGILELGTDAKPATVADTPPYASGGYLSIELGVEISGLWWGTGSAAKLCLSAFVEVKALA